MSWIKSSTIPFLFAAQLLALQPAQQTAMSAMLKNVPFDNSLQLDGERLKLNGLAVRHKTIFKVPIYVAGLYLETPSHDMNDVYTSSELKVINLVFKRNITRQQLVDSWNDSLTKKCRPDCGSYTKELALLNSFMTDVEAGQKISFVFYPDHLEIRSQGRSEAIQGRGFENRVLFTFLGSPKAPDELSAGLLGQSKESLQAMNSSPKNQG